MKVRRALSAVVADLKSASRASTDSRCQHEQGFASELEALCDELSDITRTSYDATAEAYASVRGDRPSSSDIDAFNRLLGLALGLVNRGVLGRLSGLLRLLDVGTGHGRDLSYFASIPQIEAFGIDSSKGFLTMLGEQQRSGGIPRQTVFGMDMMQLAFADETFDIVRHNSTLVHLPLIGPGHGIDKALAETQRVLKPHGLLYALVKAGEGIILRDTGEGLGVRFFQLFSEETLGDVLVRNGFRVLEITRRESRRSAETIEWLSVIAQRPGQNV
jgi:ubiquinone/menaquinone biosynthesis C-methylase UbiE